jgi:hypothetical protein
MRSQPIQDTLSRRISEGKDLTEKEIQALLKIIGAYCQERTKGRIERALRYVPDIPNYGIYGRVHLEDGGADYCAGQSYPDEIRTLRKCLIEG